MGTQGSFWQRRQIPLFFILAFALSWLVWGSQIAEQQGLLGFHIPGKLAYFGVSFAAFIVAGLAGGRAAVMLLLKRMVRWRVDPLWYGAAILLPILLALATVGLYRLAGGSAVMGTQLSLTAALLYFVTNAPFMLITEETGWRGFALPRLQAQHSALVASLLIGLIWGIWHTPLFFMAGEAQSSYPYVAFVLFAMAESILTTWIFNHTHGSVLLTTLFHAATDAALVYTGVVSGSAALFWLAAGITWLAAVAVIALEGAASLARTQADSEAGFVPSLPDLRA